MGEHMLITDWLWIYAFFKENDIFSPVIRYLIAPQYKNLLKKSQTTDSFIIYSYIVAV